MGFLGLTSNEWTDIGISLLLVVATLLLGRWTLDFLLKRLIGSLARRTETKLDDTLLAAVRPVF